MLKHLAEKFKKHAKKIDTWFLEQEANVAGEPIYASVDLRNAGYKIAPVDTNIFPAGFNNLCPSYRREASRLFTEYLMQHHPHVARIAILAEEHTRNLHYFENLYYLKKIIEDAGFEVEIASLSSEINTDSREFETSEHNKITIFKAHVQGYLLKISSWKPDLIVVNNDFSTDIPKLIKKIVQPMVPTPCVGWHTRKKSDHFTHYERLTRNFVKLIDIDPWFICSYFTAMGEVNFEDRASMVRLATKVEVLLSDIRQQYKEYRIKEIPYVFVKNDAGTYGLAVMTIQSGDQLLNLNKRQRQNMKIGKGKKLVSEVIIQEGIPTIDRFKEAVAEPVIYLVANKVAGGFFRLHENESARDNLNQPGMKFTKLCFHEMLGYSNEYKGECDLECLGMIYKNIARIASIAAGYEIKGLCTHISSNG